LLEDVKEACEDVKDAIHAGLVAVQEAWDNLDPGLKQWLITRVSFVLSIKPPLSTSSRRISFLPSENSTLNLQAPTFKHP
jgi:hypothetical protein